MKDERSYFGIKAQEVPPGRFIDRAEVFNKLATENTDDFAYRARVYSILGAAPSVDAVEVVRCRRCVHADPTWGWCNLLDTGVESNSFCSFAEEVVP